MPLSSINDAIKDIKAGKMVVVVDDEDRENEGDLAMAAELITPEAVNFMAMEGRGLICVPIIPQRLEQLRIPMMTYNNTARMGTAFTVSVDVLDGATTGISAHDRAATIKALIDPRTKPEDLAQPGHIFPLHYTEGGVLKRTGHTEAVVDLARLAGLQPAGVICEVVADDGNMARMPDLEKFAEKHDLKIVAIADIIAFRQEHERLIERVSEARVPTKYGVFTAVSYNSLVDRHEHVALVKGEIYPDKATLVRVHSECLTGDVFGSIRCDCGDQRDLALKAIGKEESGVFLYMRQEGRGIGIHNKLKAYALQDDEGLDTVDANIRLGFPPDARQYGVGAQILVDLGVRKMRFLTNNPKKRVGIESFGLELVEQVPLIAPVTEENRRYMDTKSQRMGHMLDLDSAPTDDLAAGG